MKLLLVEDDKALGATLKSRLEKEQFTITWLRTKGEALLSLSNNNFDLAILDVGLPDGDGFELAENILQNKSLPIIFLTAMDSAEYRLRGYELGADEYIPKPFHFKELLLRIEKVLNMRGLADSKQYADFTIDFNSHAIKFSDGRTETPTSRDFALLSLLVRKAPAVVSRETMISQITAGEKTPTQRTIDNSIVRLRQQLGENGKNYIKSIRGVGYQWMG